LGAITDFIVKKQTLLKLYWLGIAPLQAQDNYSKADADLNLSRAEVEKQRMNSSIKGQNSEDYKNEYANQLQKTNNIQVGY